jgi:hypothetical protein
MPFTPPSNEQARSYRKYRIEEGPAANRAVMMAVNLKPAGVFGLAHKSGHTKPANGPDKMVEESGILNPLCRRSPWHALVLEVDRSGPKPMPFGKVFFLEVASPWSGVLDLRDVEVLKIVERYRKRK